jgi:hypothetical protein
MPVIEETTLRIKFFEYLFKEEKGFICIATQRPKNKASFSQKFFEWPTKKDELSEFVEESLTKHHVWFCINLLKKPERKKEHALPSNLVWADLDTCSPDDTAPGPQVVIESSPGRFQAIWRTKEVLDPVIAEEYSRRLAYTYNQNGADPSGWDITQLLRVPFTLNFKYGSIEEGAPQVKLLKAASPLLPSIVFESMELPPGVTTTPDDSLGIPDLDTLPKAEFVIYKYSHHLAKGKFQDLFNNEPDADWSKALWHLINLCLEAGMSTEETLAVAAESACNKYQRDQRPISWLWREILKAEAQQKGLLQEGATFRALAIPDIVDESELKALPKGFVDDYITWASAATDAVPRYHELSAFMLLSSIVAGNVKLEASYGRLVPNLWGLVIGDSTLTRKTTAMQLAMGMIYDIDIDLMLATEGSAEGILGGLADRPGKVSILYRDEVVGMFNAFTKKDYLAGMPEILTNLYDVPPIYTRRLKAGPITIRDPVFIFFAGGIRDNLYDSINDDFVLSGFLPRFLIVSGNSDISRIRRTGPRSEQSGEARDNIRSGLSDLYETYATQQDITIAGQKTQISGQTECFLTTEAWERYGDIEMQMVEAASTSVVSPLALPTFERLSRSLLKMAVLLAAERQKPEEGTIQADVQDIVGAARFIQDWGRDSIDLILNAGRSFSQKRIETILLAIAKNPGITRSKLMQHYKLDKREMDGIFGTLADRGQVRSEQAGRGMRLWTVDT